MWQEGYSVNTFKLINSEGKEVLCKFHVLPKEGRGFVSKPSGLPFSELILLSLALFCLITACQVSLAGVVGKLMCLCCVMQGLSS